MMSGGIFGIDDLIGAGTDLIGGAIGSAFGGDDAPPTTWDQAYGDFKDPAQKMSYGSKIGRRIAMGDPAARAYFKSMMKSDPDKVNEFINAYGADFRTTEGEISADPSTIYGSGTGLNTSNTGMFPLQQPPAFAGISGNNNPYYRNQDLIRGQTSDDMSQALDKTLNRLSSSGMAPQQDHGYSFGNSQPAQIGGFKAQQPKFDLNLKTKSAGSGNKYAKLNQERETGSMF